MPSTSRWGRAKLHFLHPDVQGTIGLVTDESGSEVRHTVYAPYGEVYQESASIDLRYGWTGAEQDQETELVHLGVRQHDPLLARFTRPDPITPDVFNPRGLNPYAYGLNNPVRYTDPSGYAPDAAGDEMFPEDGDDQFEEGIEDDAQPEDEKPKPATLAEAVKQALKHGRIPPQYWLAVVRMLKDLGGVDGPTLIPASDTPPHLISIMWATALAVMFPLPGQELGLRLAGVWDDTRGAVTLSAVEDRRRAPLFSPRMGFLGEDAAGWTHPGMRRIYLYTGREDQGDMARTLAHELTHLRFPYLHGLQDLVVEPGQFFNVTPEYDAGVREALQRGWRPRTFE